MKIPLSILEKLKLDGPEGYTPSQKYYRNLFCSRNLIKVHAQRCLKSYLSITK